MSEQSEQSESTGIDPQDVIDGLLEQVADLSGRLAMARATIRALRRPGPGPTEPPLPES